MTTQEQLAAACRDALMAAMAVSGSPNPQDLDRAATPTPGATT